MKNKTDGKFKFHWLRQMHIVSFQTALVWITSVHVGQLWYRRGCSVEPGGIFFSSFNLFSQLWLQSVSLCRKEANIAEKARACNPTLSCVCYPSMLFNHCIFFNSQLLVPWCSNFLILLVKLFSSISFSDLLHGFQQRLPTKLNCPLAKTGWNGRKWRIYKLFNSLLLKPPLSRLPLSQNLPHVWRATKEKNEKERSEEITRQAEPKNDIIKLILWFSRIIWIIWTPGTFVPTRWWLIAYKQSKMAPIVLIIILIIIKVDLYSPFQGVQNAWYQSNDSFKPYSYLCEDKLYV